MEKLFEHEQVLALFLVFFVPGFLSLKVYDLLVPGERRDFSRAVFDAVAYSALNFGVLLPLIALMRSSSLPAFWWYACAFVILVACPIAWPFALLRFLQIPWVAKRVVNPIPRVWDCIFGENRTGSSSTSKTKGASVASIHQSHSARAAQRTREYSLRKSGGSTKTGLSLSPSTRRKGF